VYAVLADDDSAVDVIYLIDRRPRPTSERARRGARRRAVFRGALTIGVFTARGRAVLRSRDVGGDGIADQLKPAIDVRW